MLAEGKAADLFMIDINKLDCVGALLDPMCLLGTVGYTQYVDMTMINGKVVFKDGRLQTIDEEKIRDEAKKVVAKVYEDLP